MIIGSSLAHYTILRKLGSGGMGEVYLAQDTRLGRQVALKVLLADVAADPDRRARLEREARAVAALSHPNIVTVHSIEHAGEVHFITMELVDGKALSAVIPRDGLPLKQFFALALPLADAIGAAHERGVTHRDLKPENVMVGDDGRVKVLDFGLAKMRPGFIDGAAETAAISAKGKTQQGQIIGTIAYMSPEQAEGKVLDHRSDIFSLGILLHEMITGRRPFDGDSHASIVSSILRDVPPPVTEINPELPTRLGRIIQRCLEKAPSRRYQSAVDLRNDLSELEEDVRSGIRDAAAARVSASPGRSLNPWVVAAAVAVLAVAAGGAYWLLGRNQEATGPEALGETSFDQLTHLSGEELFPSLSPDGRVIVYVSAAQGKLDIYSQRVGGENPINLTRDSRADDSQPAFSPDGERVAFRSERGGGGIFVMGATGESPRLVANFGYHPAWSPDGQQIVCMTQSVTDPASRFTTSQIWVITLATGERRLLSEGDAAQPHWSPNGHRIAFWARTGEGGAGDIFTIPAQGGASPVAVTTDAALDWNPVWSGDGRYLYFASNRGGSMNLWRIGIDEATGRPRGRPQAVTTSGGTSNQHLSISNDGKRIAYVSRVETMNMQRVAFDPATGATKGSPEWIIRGSRAVVEPEPSPDGLRLVFSTAGTRQDIVVGNADGTAEQLLTDDAFKDRGPRWSPPNGSRIAFYSDRTGQNEIWTINRDGSGRQQLTRSPGAHYPVWSPDGLRMAYSTHSPNGAFIFEPGKPWDQQTPTPLPTIADTTQTFEIWSWSLDGRRLAGQKHLTDLSHAGIGIHEIGSKDIQWATDFGEWPVWLRDSRRLLFSHQGKLSLLDTASGKHHEVLSLPQPTLGVVGLSTDEKTIYFTVMVAEADVWLMTIK
ncbi:MAG: protein kinase [Vicinamibacterales bacterium]